MNRTLPAILLALLTGASLAAPPAPAQPAAAQPAAAPPLSGKVLETKDAEPYTYLRLQTSKGEVWAAVMKTPVKPGAQVTVQNPMVMTNFHSNTLNRTFDRIVFGTLAGAAAPAAGQASMPPHGAAAAAESTPVGKVDKATGADARTVAEVYARRAQLQGKTVAVRGQVVKVSANIMGKNWVHLRDGTGSAKDSTNDLVATTTQVVMVGDVVTAKGVVKTDVDIGMGMTYMAIVEDAKLTK